MSLSRNRSETFIKQGSESSYEGEESSPEYDEGRVNYLLSCSLIFAIHVAAFLTVIINAFYFTYLLKGCGVRLVDFAVAFLTFSFGMLAVFFLYITKYLRSHLSLRPFIVYHAFSLIITILLGIIFILYLLNIELIVKLLTKIRQFSTVFPSLETYDFTQQTLIGVLLSCSIAVHSICLHISWTYYASLNCFLNIHARNMTFV